MPNIDLKSFILSEFKFAKSAKSISELWARQIEIRNGGALVPLSYLHLDNGDLIDKIGEWRAAASYAYPKQFKITHDGTRKWMKELVLDDSERILFLIYDKNSSLIGHAGFASVISRNGIFEIDNVLRGEISSKNGLMSLALGALQEWARKTLFADGFMLKVLASNNRAIRFYEFLGYKITSEQALTRIMDNGMPSLVPAGPVDSVDDKYLTMTYSEPIFENDRMILTAGPSIGMREQVYTSDAVVHGWNNRWNAYLKDFEDYFGQYVGAKYCLATSSCTGALHISLAALGIGPGDEVIVPDLTWVSSANAVLYVGATPIFADIDSKTWTLDPKSFEEKISKRTKAVIPVHLYGHPCDMDPILAVAEKHNIFVVEDAAPSIGAEYKGKKTGSFGHFAAFSFQGAKLAVTGEGGMLVTNDVNLYRKAYTLWDQGRRAGTFWIEGNGLKYKMSNMQAAFGLAQMERCDAMIYAKRRIYDWYTENLSTVDGIEVFKEADWATSILWMTSLTLTETAPLDRDNMISLLKERNVDTRPVFPAISQYPIWPGKQAPQPNAKRVGERSINLPSGVCISRAEVDFVCKKIIEILQAREPLSNSLV